MAGCAGIAAAFVFTAPRLWKHFETFDTGSDYRIPYQLSKDYWLYQRWLTELSDPQQVAVIGDSVVWGEYCVAPRHALSFPGR